MIAQIGFAATGVYINRYEGSLGTSKVVAELGAFGILLIIIYIVIATRYFLRLRKIAVEWDGDFVEVFAYSFIVSFAIYLFVRGGGYFTPNVFYFLTGIVILQMRRRRVI